MVYSIYFSMGRHFFYYYHLSCTKDCIRSPHNSFTFLDYTKPLFQLSNSHTMKDQNRQHHTHHPVSSGVGSAIWVTAHWPLVLSLKYTIHRFQNLIQQFKFGGLHQILAFKALSTARSLFTLLFINLNIIVGYTKSLAFYCSYPTTHPVSDSYWCVSQLLLLTHRVFNCQIRFLSVPSKNHFPRKRAYKISLGVYNCLSIQSLSHPHQVNFNCFHKGTYKGHAWCPFTSLKTR